MHLILSILIAGILGPIATSSPATPQQIARFGDQLAELQTSLALAESSLEPHDWRYRECRFQSLERPIWSAREERLTAVCAVEKWPVPLEALIALGSCESGWNRLAWNPAGYAGIFQHSVGAFPGRVRAFEPPTWSSKLSPDWRNSRSQIVMTVRMIRAVGWGPWGCA
jgi:hypothetical protein